MRQITVFSMRLGVPKNITSGATTWGELKNELISQGIDPNGMKAIVKDLAITLEADAAQLPEGSFVVMLTPSEVKSGN